MFSDAIITRAKSPDHGERLQELDEGGPDKGGPDEGSCPKRICIKNKMVIVYDSTRRRTMKVFKHAEFKNLLAYMKRN